MTEMTREQKYATTRDEELVLLAQSGDEEAQEFLLDKYKFWCAQSREPIS